MPIATAATLPRVIKPMLPRLARKPFDSPDHLFELKWDGMRALAFLEGGRARLQDQALRDITPLFPELQELAHAIRGEQVVLDGEVVCLDVQNRPSFVRLSDRLRRSGATAARRSPVTYVAYDALYLSGRSLMREPLALRKNVLHDILVPGAHVTASHVVEAAGTAYFEATIQLSLEGIVAKEKSSPYWPGRRSANWLEIRRVRDSAFVVGGYTFRGGREEPFSSLLLGLYDESKRLVYVGSLRSGITKQEARRLLARLSERHTTNCPFEYVPNLQSFVYWCRPEMVCEVQYGEFSPDRRLVYATYVAMREDKPPADCTLTDAPGWPHALAVEE